MNRLPITLFWLLVALFVSYVISSSSVLPKQMATHFDGGGMPNGWMSRNGYIRFMLAFGLGVPFFVVGLHYFLARYAGNQFNIPNREYWLAPERRADTLRFVIYHSWWLGCLMLLFILASHYLLLATNRSSPPHLPTVPFLLLIVAFLVALGGWIVVLMTRFRKKS